MDIERRITTSETAVEERCACQETGEKRPVIVGYAAVFNSESRPLLNPERRSLDRFVEVIHPRAFDDVLSNAPDTLGLFNHDKSKLLGRVSNGSLKLKADEYGLRYEITPPNTQEARDVVELVRGGYVVGSSFAFACKKDGGDAWSTGPNGVRRREIRSVDILEDVGPVVRPAYNASSVVVSRRALEMAVGESFRASQTMANAAKRGLKQAQKLENVDQLLAGIAERMAGREILTPEEVAYLENVHQRCLEQRSSGWHGSPEWVEWQLAGGDAGEKWISRRADDLRAEEGAQEPQSVAVGLDLAENREDSTQEASSEESNGDLEARDEDEMDPEDEASSGNLSPNNYHLYEAIEQISETDGKWPQGGADGAHYMVESPFAEKGILCSSCVFFNEGGSCDVVEGEIAAGGVCKLWIIPEEKISDQAEKPEEATPPEPPEPAMRSEPDPAAPSEGDAAPSDSLRSDAIAAAARLKAASLGASADGSRR